MSAATAHDLVAADTGRPPLYDHQVDAINFALARRGAILDIGMGGGKSRAVIEIAERTQAQRILILCPRSVVGVWPREIREHADRRYVIWAGKVQGARGPLRNPSVARRAVALIDATKMAVITGRPLVAIVNFEAAWQGDMGQLLIGSGFDLVDLDESHRIKAPGGKASRYVARLTERVRAGGGRILATTGTLMPQSPLDVYGQCRAVDPTIFGTNNAVFKARYAARKILRTARAGEPIYMVGPNDEALQPVGRRPGGTVIRPARAGEPIYAVGPKGEVLYDGIAESRTDEFTQRLGQIVFRVSQEELDEKLDLPKTVDIVRSCDLEPATRRVYDELEKDLIAETDAGYTVTAANRMVLTTRLAQISGGFTKDPDGNLVQVTDPPEKARLLGDILEDLDQHEPVIVFCRFHADLDAVRQAVDKLGRRYAELSGRRRDGLTEDSRMTPDADVVGVQLQSGGVGIDFTRARYAIYYSLDYSLSDHDQSRKRLHRPGQTRRTTYIYLLANDTVDWAVRGALKQRKDVIKAVTDRLHNKETAP